MAPPVAAAAAAQPVAGQTSLLHHTSAVSAAATAVPAAVPPLKLLQALPLSAAAATGAATAPTHPARASYQLTDSHGALDFVTPADGNNSARALPNSAAATAGLLLQAAAEQQQPWTQNTARALRRTQQEVAELCAARWLPLPGERAYCFGLVGKWQGLS
jgi:hypothetical protein